MHHSAYIGMHDLHLTPVSRAPLTRPSISRIRLLLPPCHGGFAFGEMCHVPRPRGVEDEAGPPPHQCLPQHGIGRTRHVSTTTTTCHTDTPMPIHICFFSSPPPSKNNVRLSEDI